MAASLEVKRHQPWTVCARAVTWRVCVHVITSIRRERIICKERNDSTASAIVKLTVVLDFKSYLLQTVQQFGTTKTRCDCGDAYMSICDDQIIIQSTPPRGDPTTSHLVASHITQSHKRNSQQQKFINARLVDTQHKTQITHISYKFHIT